MISSFRNPLVKQIKRLRQKKYRQREGVFFVEGIRAVLTAVNHHAAVETLVYAPELLTSEVALEMVYDQQRQGTRCEAVTSEVFQTISERDNPTGLGAVVRSPERPLTELKITADSLFIALTGIADPGNLGTILRTADAVGAAGIILVGQTTDVGHPTAAKASMGTLFTVPIATTTAAGLLSWAAARRLHTVTTSAHATQLHWESTYQFPLLLIMGSEKEGVPADIATAAAQAIKIPMLGQASSLNLAIATGIILYEIRRQHFSTST